MSGSILSAESTKTSPASCIVRRSGTPDPLRLAARPSVRPPPSESNWSYPTTLGNSDSWGNSSSTVMATRGDSLSDRYVSRWRSREKQGANIAVAWHLHDGRRALSGRVHHSKVNAKVDWEQGSPVIPMNTIAATDRGMSHHYAILCHILLLKSRIYRPVSAPSLVSVQQTISPGSNHDAPGCRHPFRRLLFRSLEDGSRFQRSIGHHLRRANHPLASCR